MTKPTAQIKDRLREALDVRNLTQQELADMANIPKSSISQYLSGYAKPKNDRIFSMASALGVNEAWLLGYDVPMSKSLYGSTEEATILREVSVAYQAPSQSSAVRIKVYGTVPAGVPVEAIEDVVDWEEIPKEWTKGNQEYFGLRVKGDSMYPKYQEGDTIIIRKQPVCENGDDCIVYVNGHDATLKKVLKKQDCIVLQPLNPEYEPTVYDYNDEFNPVVIVGVVVEIRRKV